MKLVAFIPVQKQIIITYIYQNLCGANKLFDPSYIKPNPILDHPFEV